MVSRKKIDEYKAKAKKDKKSVIIDIEGGVLVNVTNLPKGFTYTLVDYDVFKEMDDEEFNERFMKL
jgi:hypothetical protein